MVTTQWENAAVQLLSKPRDDQGTEMLYFLLQISEVSRRLNLGLQCLHRIVLELM